MSEPIITELKRLNTIAKLMGISRSEWARVSGVKVNAITHHLLGHRSLNAADIERLRVELARVLRAREIILADFLAAEARR